jgi:hypothetical protein
VWPSFKPPLKYKSKNAVGHNITGPLYFELDTSLISPLTPAFLDLYFRGGLNEGTSGKQLLKGWYYYLQLLV